MSAPTPPKVMTPEAAERLFLHVMERIVHAKQPCHNPFCRLNGPILFGGEEIHPLVILGVMGWLCAGMNQLLPEEGDAAQGYVDAEGNRHTLQ